MHIQVLGAGLMGIAMAENKYIVFELANEFYGIPNTTDDVSSCATVTAPALRIETRPLAPSLPIPVMITPMALRPAYRAVVSKSTSTDGR